MNKLVLVILIITACGCRPVPKDLYEGHPDATKPCQSHGGLADYAFNRDSGKFYFAQCKDGFVTVGHFPK